MIHGWSAFGGPTMVDTKSKWEDELGRWLEPFLDRLGHKARRRMCPLYISGLIGPGDRKSVQPMAARLAPGEYDQLHHFIADGVWDAAPLEAELLVQADRLVGGKDAVLVIDDTAMPKKGDRSFGVAPQYASSLGKTANCQTLVSLTLARGEVPVMVALRLFVPESWTNNPVRLKRAGVPVEHRAARTKTVYPADIALIFPIAKTGKPRKYHIPDQPPVSAEVLLAEGKWQRVSWRRGTKGRLTCLFTARRVRVADGHKHRMLNNRMQCMPGEEVWLVGERRSTGEQKYYVSNLPADATIKTLAATIKARWVCEQAHQQLKEELGLDHFEGRSWTGLHRHALMTMIAYAFLQSRRLKAAGRKKKNLRTATTTKHAGHQASDPRPLRTTSTPTMSSL